MEWYEKDGQIYGENGRTLALIPYYDKANKEHRANARLIAAVPDMLETCKISNKVFEELIKLFNHEGRPISKAVQTAYLMTLDVLAKAEGRE